MNDPHTQRASEMFGVPTSEVNPVQRRAAKADNYRRMYSTGPRRFAKLDTTDPDTILPWPMTEMGVVAKAVNLSPLARKVVSHILTAGHISARDAFHDLDITSASLTRRLTDIESAGIPIRRERRVHPTTGKPYTRYGIEGLQKGGDA